MSKLSSLLRWKGVRPLQSRFCAASWAGRPLKLRPRVGCEPVGVIVIPRAHARIAPRCGQASERVAAMFAHVGKPPGAHRPRAPLSPPKIAWLNKTRTSAATITLRRPLLAGVIRSKIPLELRHGPGAATMPTYACSLCGCKWTTDAEPSHCPGCGLSEAAARESLLSDDIEIRVRRSSSRGAVVECGKCRGTGCELNALGIRLLDTTCSACGGSGRVRV